MIISSTFVGETNVSFLNITLDIASVFKVIAVTMQRPWRFMRGANRKTKEVDHLIQLSGKHSVFRTLMCIIQCIHLKSKNWKTTLYNAVAKAL